MRPRPSYPYKRPAFTVAMQIIAKAAELRGVDPVCVSRWDRRRPIVHCRYGVMWVLRQLGLSYPRIAHHVGQKDHTTVISGERRAIRLRAEDHEFRVFTNELLAYALTLEPLAVREAA